MDVIVGALVTFQKHRSSMAFGRFVISWFWLHDAQK